MCSSPIFCSRSLLVWGRVGSVWGGSRGEEGRCLHAVGFYAVLMFSGSCNTLVLPRKTDVAPFLR